MIGYVSPDVSNLYIKDLTLYRALYCGLCKSIGATCGQISRFTLNYDLTFLSAVAHNLTNTDVTIKKEHCAMHRIKKRGIQQRDELTDEIACINVMLAYHNVRDDVIDQNKHKLLLSTLKDGYKKAKTKYPLYDRIIIENYNNLRKFEQNNADSIDVVSDCFATMLQQIFEVLLKDYKSDATSVFAYNLGKWIYLIDALDDFDKDIKDNSFNVFVNVYGKNNKKSTLLKEKQGELKYIFGEIIDAILQSFRQMKFYFNKDLIENVVTRGLIVRTRSVLENEKCKKTSLKLSV